MRRSQRYEGNRERVVLLEQREERAAKSRVFERPSEWSAGKASTW